MNYVLEDRRETRTVTKKCDIYCGDKDCKTGRFLENYTFGRPEPLCDKYKIIIGPGIC